MAANISLKAIPQGNPNYLGGQWQPRKNTFSLKVKGRQGNVLGFSWRLLALKNINLLSIVIFYWPFGEFSRVLVFLAANIQGNNP